MIYKYRAKRESGRFSSVRTVPGEILDSYYLYNFFYVS